MGDTVACPVCRSENLLGSQFCNQCGAAIPAQPAAARDPAAKKQAAERVARSEALVESCERYLAREPGEVESFDILLIVEAIRCLGTLRGISQKKDVTAFADAKFSAIAEVWPQDLPQVLENGMVVTTNISPALRQPMLNVLGRARDLENDFLRGLYGEADAEAQSLLVNGKTRAVAEEHTMDEVYDDTEIYYDAYLRDDDQGALRGFLHLKSLNPFDPYFRNMAGASYSRLGKHTEALRETLYARALDLDDVGIASISAVWY